LNRNLKGVFMGLNMKVSFLVLLLIGAFLPNGFATAKTHSDQIGPAPSIIEHRKFDAQFLDQMTAHHLDGIKMAQIAESKASNPELREMGKEIVVNQSKEVDQMKTWRSRYFSSVAAAEEHMPKMDMSQMEKASGSSFDKAFVDMMTNHHQEGLRMAQAASGKLTNPEIKHFAKESVREQQADIQRMAKLRPEQADQSTESGSTNSGK
jgi:uncharacterized protein (DUF305 family)